MNPGLVLCDLSVQPLKHVRIGLGEHATTIAFSPDEKSLVICGLSQWALPPLAQLFSDSIPTTSDWPVIPREDTSLEFLAWWPDESSGYCMAFEQSGLIVIMDRDGVIHWRHSVSDHHNKRSNEPKLGPVWAVAAETSPDRSHIIAHVMFDRTRTSHNSSDVRYDSVVAVINVEFETLTHYIPVCMVRQESL